MAWFHTRFSKFLAGALVVGAALAATPRLAAADACACVGGAYPPWGPPPAYLGPPMVMMPRMPAEAERHWGFGIRATGMSVADPMNEDAKPLGMSGGGFFFRYRGMGHIGFEMAIDGATTQDKDSIERGYQRVTALATASLIYKFRPLARFDWHLLAGFGAGETDIRYGASKDVEPISESKYQESEAHFGIGFEYKLTRGWVLSGDLRLMGLHRSNRGGDDAVVSSGTDKAVADSGLAPVVPESESGATANLGIAYYF